MRGKKIPNQIPFCIGKFEPIGHDRVLTETPELYRNSGLQGHWRYFNNFHTEPSAISRQ